MLLVIDYRLKNVIVVKVTSPYVYMFSLARVTLMLWHVATVALLQCFSLGLDTLGF